jgi:hypothetical protein
MNNSIFTPSNKALFTLTGNEEIPTDIRVDLSLHLCSVKDLRDINNHVMRNDPCICGSGKKFKKCHMDLFILHYNKRTNIHRVYQYLS